MAPAARYFVKIKNRSCGIEPFSLDRVQYRNPTGLPGRGCLGGERAGKCLTSRTPAGTISMLNACISLSRVRPARPVRFLFPEAAHKT